MSYYIKGAENFVIYGCGQIGLSVCNRLIEKGLKVVAIADRSPNQKNNLGISVMSAENAFSMFGDAVVFISLGNALEHTKIAKDLYDLGFSKVLYIPAFLRGRKASAMTHSWNSFFVGFYEVPIMERNELYTVLSSDYVIDEIGSYITAIVHKDFIHTAIVFQDAKEPYSYYLQHQPQWKSITDKTADLPITSNIVKELLPMRSVFTDDTFEFYENTMFDLNGYYIDAPPVAVFNKCRGYFNLIDGGHRSRFLIEKGFTGIPLRMKKEDWQIYFREPQAQKMMDYVYSLESLPMNILHPAFVRFSVKACEQDTMFTSLLEELYSYDLE